MSYFHQAIHAYAAVNPRQLGFKLGERLDIITKTSSFTGWWVARNRAGEEGLVPHNFLQLSADTAETRQEDNALLLPSSSLSARDGVHYLDGSRSLPNGSVTLPDGTVKDMDQVETPPGAIRHADGVFQYPDGTRELPSGAIVRDGELITADGEHKPLKWKLPSTVTMTVTARRKSVSRQNPTEEPEQHNPSEVRTRARAGEENRQNRAPADQWDEDTHVAPRARLHDDTPRDAPRARFRDETPREVPRARVHDEAPRDVVPRGRVHDETPRNVAPRARVPDETPRNVPETKVRSNSRPPARSKVDSRPNQAAEEWENENTPQREVVIRTRAYDETPRVPPESKARSNSRPSRQPQIRLPPRPSGNAHPESRRSPPSDAFDREDHRRDPISPFSPSEFKPRETPAPSPSLPSTVDSRRDAPHSERRERGPPPVPTEKRRDSDPHAANLQYQLPQGFQVQGNRVIFPDGKSVSSSDMQLGLVKVAAVVDRTRTKLTVRVFEAVGLKAMNKDGTSDVYAKIYLMPDPKKLSKVKTPVITGTTRPKFDHVHTYKVSENLESKRLEISLFHRHMLKPEFLGMTEMDFKLFARDADPYTVAQWFPLQQAPIDLCPPVTIMLPRGTDAPLGSVLLPDGMIWLPTGLLVLPSGDIVDPKSLPRIKQEGVVRDESPVRVIMDQHRGDDDDERGRRGSVSKPSRRGSLFSNLMKPFRKPTKVIRRLANYNYFYQALFDWSPSPNEASKFAFQKGAILYVKDSPLTDAWWDAEDEAGHSGQVPCNFLRLRCEGATLEPDQSYLLPSGARSMGNESRICYPDGSSWLAEEGLEFADTGTNDELLPDGTRQSADGWVIYPNGVYHDGRGGDTLYRPDGSSFKAKWTIPDLGEDPQQVHEPQPIAPVMQETPVLFELPEGFSQIPQRDGPPRVRFPNGQEVSAAKLSGGLIWAFISFYEEADSGMLSIDIMEIRVNYMLKEAYLKCYLLPDNAKASKQKTPIMKQQHDRFAVHYKFHYKMKKKSLMSKILQLSLMAIGSLRHELAARMELDGSRLINNPAAQWFLLDDMGISRPRIEHPSPIRRYVPDRFEAAEYSEGRRENGRSRTRVEDYDSD